MDSGSALPCFYIICDFNQRSETTLSLTTKLAIIRGLGRPQQAGFANLAGGLVWRNEASVYTDAQLASLLGFLSDLFVSLR